VIPERAGVMVEREAIVVRQTSARGDLEEDVVPMSPWGHMQTMHVEVRRLPRRHVVHDPRCDLVPRTDDQRRPRESPLVRLRRIPATSDVHRARGHAQRRPQLPVRTEPHRRLRETVTNDLGEARGATTARGARLRPHGERQPNGDRSDHHQRTTGGGQRGKTRSDRGTVQLPSRVRLHKPCRP